MAPVEGCKDRLKTSAFLIESAQQRQPSQSENNKLKINVRFAQQLVRVSSIER
jgi:hypothetical protein